MTSPAPLHQPGWYPDPWKQAALRWHDGSDWSHQTQESATASVPTPPGAAHPHLHPVAQLPASQQTSGMAIAALVLGLLGFGLIAVVVGVLALRQIGRSAGELGGRGLAIAGIVVGAVWGAMVLLMLVAVAVPTFLAQKDAASATQGRANVKQLVSAVETCSASTPSGGYATCGAAQLTAQEPALKPLLDACGQAGGACIELAPDGSGYKVSYQDSAQPPNTFSEAHLDGGIAKTCDGPACPSGTW